MVFCLFHQRSDEFKVWPKCILLLRFAKKNLSCRLFFRFVLPLRIFSNPAAHDHNSLYEVYIMHHVYGETIETCFYGSLYLTYLSSACARHIKPNRKHAYSSLRPASMIILFKTDLRNCFCFIYTRTNIYAPLNTV